MLKEQCRGQQPPSQRLKLPNGRVIGRLEGDRFIKPVCASKHRLRTPPAWAIDAGVFDRSIRGLAREIVIWDRETDTRWRVQVEVFDEHKGTLDRGFGAQYFLPLPYWDVIDPNGDRQLRLWEDGANG